MNDAPAPVPAADQFKQQLREQRHMREALPPYDYVQFVGVLAVQWVELELARVTAPLTQRIGELETRAAEGTLAARIAVLEKLAEPFLELAGDDELMPKLEAMAEGVEAMVDRLTILEEQHEPLANEMRAMLAKIGAALDAPDPLEERLAAVEEKLVDVSARASGADYPGLAEAVGQLQSAVTGTDAATLRDRLDATEKRLAVLEAKADNPAITIHSAARAMESPPIGMPPPFSRTPTPYQVPIGSFGAALEHMRAGRRARRQSWTEWESIGLPLSMFRAGHAFDVRERGAVGGAPLNVILALDDMLATDWEPA